MQRLFLPLVFIAVPVAAFLTFLIQPIVGKQLMPRYGGSAGTWMTISLFFQTALLVGYALASWLGSIQRLRALACSAVLALLAPLTARLPPWDFPDWPEWPAIVAGLTLSLLPALLLTTSIGIVVQGWMRGRAGRVPYYLYGISNLGSLLALFLYPFEIEPRFGLADQSSLVRALLWALSAVVLALVALEYRLHRDQPIATTPVEEVPELIDSGRVITWLVLTFATCTLMLGGVRLLSAEIGSNPLAWLIPLGVYLLSFTIAFSGWWRPEYNNLALVAFAAGLYGFMSTKGVSDDTLGEWARTWLVVVIAAGSIAAHGFVYRLRPERRFSYFYLIVATGGALAGLFASIGAPNIFNRNIEFSLAAFLLFVATVLFQLGRDSHWERLTLAALVTLPAGWHVYAQLAKERGEYAPKVTYLRNYYGVLVLRQGSTYLNASNETTLHGTQLLNEKIRDTPTTYYTRGSAVGVVMRNLQASQPAMQIGAIGLGVGTLAAYPRATDSIVFWDINPESVRVARETFFFLRDCKGKNEVRLLDGRRGVREAPETFDVLVVDAFAGDSIPIHLLTVDAMREYLAKLSPNGIILFHISNRYTDLFPVVIAGAQQLGWRTFQYSANPSEAIRTGEHGAKSNYAVFYPPARHDEVTRWFEDAAKEPNYDSTITYIDGIQPVIWTDDRHAIRDVITDW